MLEKFEIESDIFEDERLIFKVRPAKVEWRASIVALRARHADMRLLIYELRAVQFVVREAFAAVDWVRKIGKARTVSCIQPGVV